MDRDRLRACSSEDLVRSSIQVAARLASTQAALLDMIAIVDERELWRSDGCLSLEDWVSFTYQVSRRTAHEWSDAARALGNLPHLSEAFASGELSWDKARAVAAMATSESDSSLTEEAKQTDVKHLERAARRSRAISIEEARERHRSRFFAMRRSITLGGVRLSGFIPDVDGETVIKAIEQLADDVPKDPETGFYPSYDERCPDALVELAGGSLASDQPRLGERAMVVTHVDASDGCLTAEMESGMPLARESAERLMCDAAIEPVVEVNGMTAGLGRKHRVPPGWLRRQLVERDLGCSFPGCCRTRGLHAHHIKHWVKGGETESGNLTMLCRAHHRLMHEGGWSIRGDTGGRLEFVKPDG